jgi:aquaporin Z
LGDNVKRYFAELVGTYVLVFSGVGAAVLAGKHIGNVGVAFAFGLSLLVMVYAIGPISGCHINPAVTFGMWLSRKINAKDSVMYVIAQIIGAILAAGCVLFIARGMPGGYVAHISGLASNGYGAHSPDLYSMGAGFVAEVILTGFLVFTVIGATDIKAPVGFAGLAIGIVLVVDHLVSIPITNTSVNPARSIGPALYARGWAVDQLWLFIVAPLIGGAIAAGIFALIRTRPEPLLSTREAERALRSQQTERGEERQERAS